MTAMSRWKHQECSWTFTCTHIGVAIFDCRSHINPVHVTAETHVIKRGYVKIFKIKKGYYFVYLFSISTISLKHKQQCDAIITGDEWLTSGDLENILIRNE